MTNKKPDDTVELQKVTKENTKLKALVFKYTQYIKRLEFKVRDKDRTIRMLEQQLAYYKRIIKKGNDE